MRILTSIIIICSSFIMTAQSDIKTIQNEIDKTVWKPFQKAFETLDADTLNATYADNVLRATPQGIDTNNVFKGQNIERFETSKKNNVEIKLDFWFDSRRTNTSTSYEVGFYRIQSTVNRETSNSYGQFHIVLQKINGMWKITQDWDTTIINGHIIDKVDFEKQIPLKF